MTWQPVSQSVEALQDKAAARREIWRVLCDVHKPHKWYDTRYIAAAANLRFNYVLLQLNQMKREGFVEYRCPTKTEDEKKRNKIVIEWRGKEQNDR